MSFPGSFLPEDIADSYAVQALFRGQAEEHQQIRAMKWIVEELCGAYAMSYDPENSRNTDFNEGKRHVGRVLVGIATINLGAVKAADERLATRGLKRKRGRNG